MGEVVSRTLIMRTFTCGGQWKWSGVSVSMGTCADGCVPPECILSSLDL